MEKTPPPHPPGGDEKKQSVKRKKNDFNNLLKEDLTIAEFKEKYPMKNRSYRKEHRCNRRVDDVLDAFGFSTWSEVRYRFGLLRKCLASKPGNEPTEAFGVRKDTSSKE